MTKLTEQEIKKVNDLKIKFNGMVQALGSTEIQLINLNLKKEQLKVEVVKVQDEEVKLAKELEEKYGSGTISLETGEFSPDK
jgi:stress response protein YsnF|tara:strand:+ start:524 stop:769 length:246 start_codon:yes stop_codon:yes gene_type:complete